MATKNELIERTNYIRSLIEAQGHTAVISPLPKKYKKEDIYKVINDLDKQYQALKQL